MNSTKPLTIACVGCGARAQTYVQLASRYPDRFHVVAAADPVPERVEKIRRFSNNPQFRAFPHGQELLAAGKLADVILIATQDSDHFAPCRRALEMGYDVWLEKPIATRMDQVLEIERLAKKMGRRVLVCFVLRFAAFYRKVKEIIDSGALGEIVSIHANEGVMPWHQAHSFVRGHWAVTGSSSPMILSKCCHDMDLIHWLVGRACRSISSYGSLEFFRPERAPKGAPLRCTSPCPEQPACPYDALRYAGDMRTPWLGQVYDRAADASREEIVAWLSTSPWGRCVYHCNNDAVDRQVLALEFDGGIIGSFTMTAFATGRHIEVCGTRGVLKGGETFRQHLGVHLLLLPHEGPVQRFTVQADDGGYELHGGGDAGLVDAVYNEMTKPSGLPLAAPIGSTVHSHVIAFAAEESRQTRRCIDLAEYLKAFA